MKLQIVTAVMILEMTVITAIAHIISQGIICAIVKLLINDVTIISQPSRGIDPWRMDSKEIHKESFFHLCCRRGLTSIGELMLTYGADADGMDSKVKCNLWFCCVNLSSAFSDLFYSFVSLFISSLTYSLPFSIFAFLTFHILYSYFIPSFLPSFLPSFFFSSFIFSFFLFSLSLLISSFLFFFLSDFHVSSIHV